jgi:AcrR family transcriptional regulator
VSQKKGQSVDQAKRLALLWSSQHTTGRSGLSLKAIVAAAMEIADAQGVDALSMRNVAERLGVGTMSLYTHVPSKAELIELMVDTAYGELYTSMDEPAQQAEAGAKAVGGGDGDGEGEGERNWRAALRFIAQRNWELYRKHAWMLHVSNGRPNLGPHTVFKYEAELRPLDNLGLSDVEMDATLTLILTHVEGCARAQNIVERTRLETGMSDSEWWVEQAPVLDRIIDGSRFPVASRVGESSSMEYQAASSPEYAFTFGLECILAGVAELIRSKANG